MSDDVPSKNVWAQRLNYIKNYVKFVTKYPGLGLKTLALLVLLICWGVIVLGTFSH